MNDMSSTTSASGFGQLYLQALQDAVRAINGINASFSSVIKGGPLSVRGNATNATAPLADISGAADQVLRVNTAANALAFGTVNTGGITANAVTYAKIAQGTGLSVLGVTGNAAANNADIVAGSDATFLRRSGTALGFGSDLPGNLSLTGGAVDRLLHISASSGQNRYVQFETLGSARWATGANATAESGGNVGSDFFINRYDDTGAFIDTTFNIKRSTGYSQVTNRIGIGTAPSFPLDILVSTATLARLQSAGANNSQLLIDNQAGGNQSVVMFYDANVQKWVIGKQTDNSFLMFDTVNAKNFLGVSTAGDVAIGESTRNVSFAAASSVSSPFLQVQNGTAASNNEFQEWKPTDWASGKPYLFTKAAGNAIWQIGLWDGSTTAGTINMVCSTLQQNGSNVATLIAPTAQLLTSSQTVTIPANATKCKVTLVGGGGGSGGATGVAPSVCTSAHTGAGGPGGAAGVVIKYLSGLTPGNTLALTIGAAGSAGSSGPGAGGNGGDTTLASGTQSITTLTAAHGVGGGAASPTSTSVAGTVGAAGAGTNGDLNITGGVGLSLAMDSSNVNSTIGALGFSTSGSTGLLGPGQTNQAAVGAASAGKAGTGFGSGAAGAVVAGVSAPTAGAAGTAGCAVFEWYA